MQITDVAPWIPYGLLPSAPEAGRPQPEIVELRLPAGETDWLTAFRDETVDTVQAWPLDDVLKNLAVGAFVCHYLAREYESGERQARTTITELRQWIDSTRSLADRLPFAAAKAQIMAAATGLERELNGPAECFLHWPRTIETMAYYDWRANWYLWGADRLLRAVNESEPVYAQQRQAANYLTLPPTKFWPAMFDFDELPGDRQPPAFRDYEQAQKRVRRFNATIKPGRGDALMVILLREIFAHGRIRPQEPPRFAPDVH